MAGGAWRHPLHPFLQQLWRGAAEALLRPFPQGRGHRLAQAAEGVAQCPASGREVRAARRRPNGRSRARNGPSTTCSPTGSGSAPRAPAGRNEAGLRDHRRRPHLPHAAGSTKPLEITGPVAAKLFLSSETTDADVFLVLRVFDPAGKEVTFIGSNDPRTPVGHRLAARLAAQARSRSVEALPALAPARRGMAAHAGRAGRTRRRDLADLASWCRRAISSR